MSILAKRKPSIDFGSTFDACLIAPCDKFYVNDGFSFREGKLCIPSGSIKYLLVKAAHGGGLMGHFGIAKPYNILHEHFFWPKMKRNVKNLWVTVWIINVQIIFMTS